MKNIFITTLVFLISFSASAGTSWWNSAVIYEIFVRSFQDSNGDGIGDLKGITQRLDYIHSATPNDPMSLGADVIWLTPIFKSPSYHGYDTIDYKSVNPDYGTLDDFKELISESHKRGIKVILDLAVNHTSNKNPWFVQSKSSKTSPFRDWYMWSAQDPGWVGALGRWWPWSQEFYYSSFSRTLPDLNWQNSNIMVQVKDVLHFWSQLGVDGFRLDAARYYVKGPNGEADTAGTHQVLQTFIQDLKHDFPQTFFVGEIWAGSDVISSYVNSGKELDMAFNFPVSFGLQNSLVAESADAFQSSMTDTLSLIKNQSSFAPFLTNHDMIRIASVVPANKLGLAAAALFGLPGTPVIYYGEEIGLANNLPISSDDLDKRTPMQWDASPLFGFTGGKPWQPFSNASTDKNIASQITDPYSLLSTYQNLIQLRKSQPALLSGQTYSVGTDNSQVGAFARVLGEETVLVVLNFGPATVQRVNFTIDSHWQSSQNPKTTVLWGDTSLRMQAKKRSPFVNLDGLAPYSAAIIKLNNNQ
jgi:glycosidase